MKDREFLQDAIGQIDDRLIHDTKAFAAKTRRKKVLLRWSALAACLALLLTLVQLSSIDEPSQTQTDDPSQAEESKPSQTQTTEPPREGTLDLLDHTVSPEKFVGVPVVGTPTDSIPQGAAEPSWPFYFGLGIDVEIAVEADVIKVLPDLYTDPETRQKYHVLKLKIKDVILGENVPQEFYYLLNEGLSCELAQYDSLIFGVQQLGMEDYVLKNEASGSLETFTLLFESSNIEPQYGSIMAFSDGILDMSLWELDGWEVEEQYLNCITEPSQYGVEYPAVVGCSIAFAKAQILEMYRSARPQAAEPRVYTKADFTSEEAKAALAYIRPFENGVFAQSLFDNSLGVFCTRMINGFRTREGIRITDDAVDYYGEAFTADDLRAVPDIAQLLTDLNIDTLVPPHTENYEKLRKVRCGAFGWYTKVDGEVYGVVEVTWLFLDPEDDHLAYYDDLYYLAFSDGTYRMIERDELRDYIGDDSYVNDLPYNDGFWIPYI